MAETGQGGASNRTQNSGTLLTTVTAKFPLTGPRKSVTPAAANAASMRSLAAVFSPEIINPRGELPKTPPPLCNLNPASANAFTIPRAYPSDSGSPATHITDKSPLDPFSAATIIWYCLMVSARQAICAAGRPMLAALCVSRIRPGIPASGFFLAARVLGVFSGDPTGPEARAFHAIELQRVLSFYGS
jgi:hypothetical protein